MCKAGADAAVHYIVLCAYVGARLVERPPTSLPRPPPESMVLNEQLPRSWSGEI